MQDYDFMNEIFKFSQGFGHKESKDEVTRLYIEGRISKEEFMRRMKNAN